MEQTQNLPTSTGVPHWHGGYNQPGYLPETEPGVYPSYQTARDAAAADMDAAADSVETWADPHDCDDVPCPTYGEDCPWQQAGSIRAERDDLIASDGPEWSGHAGGMAWWVSICGDPACVADQVSQIAAEHCDDGSALDRFANSGAIEPAAAGEADRLRRQSNAGTEQAEVDLLYAYITASGIRGPVPGWEPR